MTLAPTVDGQSVDQTSILRLFELADIIIPFSIGVAADLKIADQLVDGPRPVEELARNAGVHTDALYRVLRALAAKEIFEETTPRTFALTPMAELMRSDHALSLRKLFLTVQADVLAFAHIGDSVRSGEPAFDLVHGEEFWSYLARRPVASAEFDELMANFTELETKAALPVYDWGSLGTVVDVGGGNGALLAGLLSAHPTLRGILFDLPTVVGGAAPVLAEAGVADRCDVVEGSFYERIPAGGNAYVMKRIIYNYPDDVAVDILRRVRAVVPADGQVLLLEPVRRRGNAFTMGHLMDLKMLVLGHGRVRDRHELRALFERAGLRLTRIVPTPMIAVIEAVPVDA
jgi:O-methyltransferase